MSADTKEIKKKKRKKLVLMVFMQFLRHYCMDQVQRVSYKKISGFNHPFAVRFYDIKFYFIAL
jgi:hypothetical protein